MYNLNEHIQYNFNNSILEITLCAKPKNYLLVDTLHEFVRIIKEFEQKQSETRAIILKGDSNSGFFSNGFHPDMFLNRSRSEITETLTSFLEFFHAFSFIKTPIFTCINGHSMGAGTIIALCTEYIYMLEGPYRIGLPEVALGMQVPQFVNELLQHKIFTPMIPDMLIYGKFHKAKKAKEIGLVRDIASTEDELILKIKKQISLGKRLPLEGIRENVLAYRNYRLKNVISLFEKEFSLILDAFLSSSVQEKFRILKNKSYLIEK